VQCSCLPSRPRQSTVTTNCCQVQSGAVLVCACVCMPCSQVVTTNNCGCSNAWDYGGVRYSGTCRTGLSGASSVPGISPDTNWCFVDKSCTGSKHLDGFAYDLCTPEGGRFTEDGRACQFPATYHEVSLYNCISYNHSTPGTPTPKPWCFTDTLSGAWGYCAPWTCTAALKSNCPAGNPADNPVGWAAPVCLETLCNARKDLANITLCTQDSQADKDLLVGTYSSLATNTSFGQLLQSTYGSGMAMTVCCKSDARIMCVGPSIGRHTVCTKQRLQLVSRRYRLQAGKVCSAMCACLSCQRCLLASLQTRWTPTAPRTLAFCAWTRSWTPPAPGCSDRTTLGWPRPAQPSCVTWAVCAPSASCKSRQRPVSQVRCGTVRAALVGAHTTEIMVVTCE